MSLRRRVPAVLEAMHDMNLSELEICIGPERVSLRRAGAVTDVPSPVADATDSHAPEGHVVCSPLAGTFFATPKPADPAFVRPGDHIREGQLIGLVEAMKVFNEIVSDVDGEVMEILVRSGDGVMAGQPLVLIDPAGAVSGLVGEGMGG